MRLDIFTIDAKKPVHVAWWAQEFGVSEKVLLEAIGAVGNRASDVSAYLKKRETQNPAHAHLATVSTQS
jgi:hypothetical protein